MTMNKQAPHTEQIRLAALAAISAQMGRGTDLDDCLASALAVLVQSTKAARGFVLLDDGEVEGLRPVAGYGAAAMSQADRTLVAEVLRAEETVLLENATALGAPLWVDGRVMGALIVAGGDFTPDDQVLVEAVAGQTAVSLENQRLQEALHTAVQEKVEFATVVTHELRLPMTVIKGYIDLLASGMSGPLTEQQGQFVDVIKRNLQRMNQLVSDLSDLNRLEAGRLKLEMKQFDLRDVVEDAVDAMQKQLMARGQTLVIEVMAGETAVFADLRRTQQIFVNLLRNAHQYTPNGGQIMVYLRPGLSFVEVIVQDNGLGISPENQAHLFTPFFRAEDETVREQPGWGLGLAVSRMLAEAQGGEISFESVLGKGSRFAFTVPSANIEAAQ